MISWRELEGGVLGVWERRVRESKMRKDDKLAGKSDEGKWQDGLLAIRRDLFLFIVFLPLINNISGMLLPLYRYFSFFSFTI